MANVKSKEWGNIIKDKKLSETTKFDWMLEFLGWKKNARRTN